MYLRVGDTVRLAPEKVSERITSVVWKYDANLLAEWVEGNIPLTYYSKFRGRTKLDTRTGSLVFENGAVSDTGEYSAEINNRVQALTHRIVILETVPQPGVNFTTVLCNSSLEICTLACEGDVSKVDHVKYFWKLDNGEWRQGDREKEIANNQDMWIVKIFLCRIENPVSGRDSDYVNNPFYQETSTGLYVTLGIVLGSVALLAPIFATVCLCCPKKKHSV